MSAMLRGNRDLIKAINRNLILNIIRREGQLSRTQVVATSGLSVGAVSQIINDLLQNHWVLEIGEGEYTGGRRQTLIRLNPAAGYAIGLKLMENRAVIAVTDFEARILYYQDCPLNFDDDPQRLSKNLSAMIEETIRSAQITRDRLFGIGIGLAGVIYSQAGIVHYSPFFGWRDVPLARLIQQQTGLPVSVENDVNTLTITEQLFGAGRHQDHFVVVTVGRGVGMGMVINGQLYRGSNGGAGELGHILIDRHRARLIGDAHGSLEALAADPAVLKMTCAQSNGNAPRTLAEAVALTQDGDAQARAALAESGEALGIGLATVINILSPKLIIISGEGVAAGDYRLKPMFAAMRRYTFNGLLDDVEVLVEPTDDRAWARGAASLVISKVFESPLMAAHAET